MAEQKAQQSQEEIMAQQRQAAQIQQQRMQYMMKVQYVENVFFQTDVKTLLTTVSHFCPNALHVSYMDAQNYKAMLTNMLLRFISEAAGIEKFAIVLRHTLISAIKSTIDIVTGQQMMGMGGMYGMQMGMNPMMGGMYGMQGMYGMGGINPMYNMYQQPQQTTQNSDNSEEAQQREALAFIKGNLQQADPIIFISLIYTLDNIDFSGDKQFEEMLRRAIWFAVQKVAYTNQMVFNNLYVIATSIYNQNQMKTYQEYWKKQMNEQKKDGNNAQNPMMGMYGMNPMMMGGMYGMQMGMNPMMGGMQMPGMGMDPMMMGMGKPMMGMSMNPMMGGMQMPGMGMDPMMGGMGMQPQMMPGMMGGMDQMGMNMNPMMMGMQQPMMGMGMNPMMGGMQMPGMGMGMMQPGMNNFAMNGGSSQSNTIV